MSARGIWGLAMTGVALLLLLIPAYGSAKPGYFAIPPVHQNEFELKASHGYRVKVTTSGERFVSLTASKGPASVTYFTRMIGPPTTNGINARFAGLGRVSVKFKPGGPATPRGIDFGCKGRDEVIQAGVFRGTIRFRGERAYTEVTASRAIGKATRSFKQICKREHESVTRPHLNMLSAGSHQGHKFLSFSAWQFSSGIPAKLASTTFIATSFEPRGHMLVIRSVFTKANDDSLQLGEPATSLSSATVSPPSPFTGTAAFQLSSDKTASWTGPLNVELPGRGPVVLAGPDFESELCRDWHCTKTRASGDTSQAAIAFGRRQMRQGSGSQSQAFWDARLSWSR